MRRFLRSRRADKRAPALEARVAHLETRVKHLEAMIEGLQDSVHRDSVRTDARLEEMRKQLRPADLSRALSQERRERGT